MFLENGVFVPYRKQVVLTKNGENDVLPTKTGVVLLRPRKPTKMMKMAGVPQTKPLFAKRHRFRHPEYKELDLNKCLLNKFCLGLDSCHREAGRDSCELFQKVLVNELFYCQERKRHININLFGR